MRREQAIAAMAACVAFAGAAKAGNIVLRAIPATTVVTSEGVAFAEFIVQGMIIDDPTATGFTTTRVILNDDASGTFSAAPLSVFDTTGAGAAAPDPLGRTGLFPSYRQSMTDPNDNTEVSNGSLFAEGFVFLALNLSAVGNGQGIAGEWTNLYKARLTSPDLAERAVTVTITSEGGAYQSRSGLVIDTEVPSTTITLVIPCPAAPTLAVSVGLMALRRRH